MNKKYPSITSVFTVLKRRLKARGLNYRDLAQALDVSEVSIKRWLSQEKLTIQQLTIIAGVIGATAAEIMQEATEPPLDHLTIEQESELMSDMRLLLVTACALYHWSLEDIVEHYDLTKTECLKYLLVLDRLRIIDLTPGNRIHLRTSSNFESLLDGPLRKFIRGKAMHDFLDQWPEKHRKNTVVLRAMLTTDAILQYENHIHQLRQKLNELHMESLGSPVEKRHSYVTYLAHREWELEEFAALRRKHN